jgi:hypothetical protein
MVIFVPAFFSLYLSSRRPFLCYQLNPRVLQNKKENADSIKDKGLMDLEERREK